MCIRSALIGLGLFGLGALAQHGQARAAEAGDWQAVMALPAFDQTASNAVMRWQAALDAMPPVAPLEQAVLEELPDEPPTEEQAASMRAMIRARLKAVGAFAPFPGESNQMPPGFAMGRGLAAPTEWRTLVRLKELHARLCWWDGERNEAIRNVVDIVRATSAAAREATDLHTWFVWLSLMEQGFETALWIARQVDAGDDELARLSKAIGAAGGTWPDGAANALRGELAYNINGAIHHLPDTRDIAEMLEALADFGPPAVPADAQEVLGSSPEPLLDPENTRELYGRMAAEFIQQATAHPTWAHGIFASAFERRSELWLAELGVFGEHAMNGMLTEYPVASLEEIKVALERCENPIGKLLVVLGAPNLDAIAFNGIRTETHRRCVRLLIEWRRRLYTGEELPASAETWGQAGIAPEEMMDPFTGQPLFFDPERLRIWSVGIDGTNQHGTGDPRENPDGSDFWWSLEPD